MAPDISAARAPVGDVATAIMEIDSILTRIHGTTETRGAAGEHDDDLCAALVIQTAQQARDVLDGYCTIIYLFITWWRKVCEARGTDALAEIVPGVISRLRTMTSVEPSAIPTMAAMMTAAAIEASPNLWREQYGDWHAEELTALQATALLLAEWINNAHDDREAAVRMILSTLERAEEDRL